MTEDTPDEAPRVESFVITTEKVVEVDFSPQEQQSILGQTGAESVKQAIAGVVQTREKSRVQPSEKLLELEVSVSEASDD